MPRIEANGLRFNVAERGDGRPVVLLHGFPDTHTVWEHQIPALADAGFRAIAPDLRGRGETDMPGDVEAYALPTLVADVAGIMDALGVERAHIVGHDWGAALAWTFAIMQPHRVDRLVVMTVGHPNARYPLFVEALRKSWYFVLFKQPFAEELLTADDWRLFRDWLSDEPIDANGFVEDLSRPGRLTAGLNWYRANLHVPDSWAHPSSAAPSVAAPTLGLFGARDFALTETVMVRSERYVDGGWRYERFDRAGHWLQLAEPARVNRLLVEFFA